jgi:hypothetical protein
MRSRSDRLSGPKPALAGTPGPPESLDRTSHENLQPSITNPPRFEGKLKAPCDAA